MVASAWLCCQPWQGPGAALQDTGLVPCPPPLALLRKSHVVWKSSEVFRVYETAPKSLKRGLVVFTHKLDRL